METEQRETDLVLGFGETGECLFVEALHEFSVKVRCGGDIVQNAIDSLFCNTIPTHVRIIPSVEREQDILSRDGFVGVRQQSGVIYQAFLIPLQLESQFSKLLERFETPFA